MTGVYIGSSIWSTVVNAIAYGNENVVEVVYSICLFLLVQTHIWVYYNTVELFIFCNFVEI